MYHGTLTWTKRNLKFCYFPVNVPDTLSGKLRYVYFLKVVHLLYWHKSLKYE